MRKHDHAFTLIELLVVISIIALLISILLPTLSAARKTAQSVQCLSQIRQTGLGTAMYANDFDDWTPVSYRGYNGQFPAPVGSMPQSTQGADWHHQLGGKLVKWGPNVAPFANAPWTDNAGYLSTTKGFYCPSFAAGWGPADDGWSTMTGGSKYHSTYYWDFLNPEQPNMAWVKTADLGTSRITYHPNNAYLSDFGWTYHTGSGPAGAAYRTPTHEDHINVLYLGGHANRVSLLALNNKVTEQDRLQLLKDNATGK